MPNMNMNMNMNTNNNILAVTDNRVDDGGTGDGDSDGGFVC